MANDAPRHAPPANVSEPPSDQRDSEFGIGKVWPFLSFFLSVLSFWRVSKLKLVKLICLTLVLLGLVPIISITLWVRFVKLSDRYSTCGMSKHFEGTLQSRCAENSFWPCSAS